MYLNNIHAFHSVRVTSPVHIMPVDYLLQIQSNISTYSDVMFQITVSMQNVNSLYNIIESNYFTLHLHHLDALNISAVHFKSFQVAIPCTRQ